jgi:hypothetical protein
LVQASVAVEAYKHAERQIFLEDNAFADRVNEFLRARVNPKTGKPTVTGKTVELGGKIALPIRRVPTNIVAEVWEHMVGLPSGALEARRAFREGIDKLTPQEADTIMRQLKNGSVGLAIMTTVFLTGGAGIGIFYQRGQKQQPGEPKEGEIQVGDLTVPRWATHYPAAEVAKVAATITKAADLRLRKGAEPQGITRATIAGLLGLAEELPAVRETLNWEKLADPAQRESFLGEYAKSVLIPGAVQESAKYLDDGTKRTPRNILEHLESGIPGLREEVPIQKKKLGHQKSRP